MTAGALEGRIFDLPSPWLRPTVVVIVIALHAAALLIVHLAPKPSELPREVVVDIEPEAPPQAPNEPEAAARPSKQTANEPDSNVLPPEAAPPVVEAPPPPVVETPPPVSLAPVPPPEAPPIPETETPPLPQAPVELAPPKPRPPRVEPPPKPAPKLVRPNPETAERKASPAPPQKTASLAARPSASTSPPAASAASQSAYVSAIAAAIRSRLFYPPAARGRGAKGVVGVAFTVGASGALTSFAITRSSGDEDLDAAARTLVQSAHFPPPPGGPVHVATSFNYVPH